MLACDAPLQLDSPRISVPAPRDEGELCLELGASRACWDGEVRKLAARTLPTSTPRGGWRCFGQSADRFCELRTRRSGLFTCSERRCRQTRTRYPDAAEWDCVDLQGAMVCRSELPAAGIDAGPLEKGFVCGTRRRHEGERVCVDLAPDVPDRESWSCRMERVAGKAERVCEPAHAARSQLGAQCSDSVPCVESARCVELDAASARAPTVERVCVPPRPQPSCWLDADCEQGERCRWGSCASTP